MSLWNHRLVQTKTSKRHFEINWPLGNHKTVIRIAQRCRLKGFSIFFLWVWYSYLIFLCIFDVCSTFQKISYLIHGLPKQFYVQIMRDFWNLHTEFWQGWKMKFLKSKSRQLNWILYMSFNKFLLAVESRDLSYKTII